MQKPGHREKKTRPRWRSRGAPATALSVAAYATPPPARFLRCKFWICSGALPWFSAKRGRVIARV